VYLEQGIDWRTICEQAERVDYEQSIMIGQLTFVRMKAWIRTYPVCLKHGQFLFFVNRKSAYIKVLSLAFELRGFESVVLWLCRILDRMRGDGTPVPWLEYLIVSRIDVFVDFVFDGDFALDQFRTKLKKHGFFQSGVEAEGKTIYFGSRHEFMMRLYVKSAEILSSGKTYLTSSWRNCGHDGQARVWRLEFEYHKKKIQEICTHRQLVAFDVPTLDRLWSHGVTAIEYVTEAATHRNLYKKPLHPLWQALHQEFFREYSVSPERVHQADIGYRYKRARPWVISWLAARGIAYEELPAHYVQDFRINESDYQKALLKLPLAGSES
jgi:hypothetical protein